MSSFSKESTRMLFCSRHWDNESYLLPFYNYLVYVLVLLAITATLGNSLILIALHKNTSLHLPSKLLLRCLSIADLCVGVISLPLAVTLVLSGVNERWSFCRITEYAVYVVTTTSYGVSLLTLTAISVDRLLALLLRLRYRQVVTVRRVRAIVFLFWLQSTVVSLVYVWSVIVYFIVSGLLIALQIIISSYSYMRIFRAIRRQQVQVQDTLGVSGNLLNMVRYKTTVFNALWVYLTLTTCYLPFAVVTVVTSIRGLSPPLFVAEGVTVIFVYLNSTLNPVLYSWKIKDVRQAVKETVRQFRACFCRQT